MAVLPAPHAPTHELHNARFTSLATPSRPAFVRTGSVPAFTVSSKTLRSFSLSNIMSSPRVRACSTGLRGVP